MPLRPLSLCLLLLAVCFVGEAGGQTLSGVDRAFFENRIRPVLVKHCFKCHSVESKELGGGLLLDSRVGLAKGGQSGPAIVPGDPAASLLIDALKYDGLEMPPEEPLRESVVHDFVSWVRRGAKYPGDAGTKRSPGEAETFAPEAVWSFKPRSQPAVPNVSDAAWPKDPIDRFILSRIESAGQTPVGDAPPAMLAKRLYYDLTGLPPTRQQLLEFAALCEEDRAVAVRDLVGTLLAKPQFGERWGRHWLDLARYGESNGDDGLGRNATFPHAWRYRDYVIDAFNADTPYDRFLTEQIAGDLLPAADAQQRNRQLVATGFLAIGPKPAAAMNKNFAMDIVDNQINVVSTTVLGLSVACARCHDHKHDPIPTRDYYALAGIFVSTETLYGLAGNEKLTAPPTELHELTSHSPSGRPSAAAEAKLEFPEGYTDVVNELTPTHHARLDAVADDLKFEAVTDLSPTSFAAVKNSRIHGRLSGPGDYSVSFWFRNETPNNARPITAYLFSRAAFGDKSLPGDHIGIGGTHDSTRTGRLFVFNGNQQKKSLAGTTVIRPNTWNHIVLARQGNTVTVVLNGNVELTGALPATYERSTEFCLGLRSDRFAPLTGHVAEFAVWDRCLSVADGQLLHDASERPRGIRSEGLAMGVRDRKKIVDCKIHIGGESGKGPAVPRGLLTAYETVSGVSPNGTGFVPPTGQSGRVELARWLTAPDHPQTARVMVNRIWQHLMGRGIVTTPDDFGVYGARPTHPELLDHLAQRFVDDGWSIKQLIRSIVLTRTYALDSRCESPLAAQDPDNELYARHARRRLDTEALRDSVLAASGCLKLEPPVGSAIRNTNTLINWPPGEATNVHQDSNHRSVYLCLLRHAPPPELAAFDLPDGVSEAGHRAETISPTQSLFLLNNPFLIRQSDELARVVLLADADDDPQRVKFVFHRILQRDPADSEITRTIDYLKQVEASLSGSKDRREQAWSSLCQALFASNEFRYID